MTGEADTPPPALTLRGLVKRRASAGLGFELRLPALTLAAGGSLALVGESGSGKSTLLDMLALASRPDEMETLRLGTADGSLDIADLWDRSDDTGLSAARAANVGYVPQSGGLFAFLDVRANIDLPRRLLGLPDDGSVETLARRLGVLDHLSKKPSALSIGQRQRVAIARALVHRPTLVLADEPTASVDPATADIVMGLLIEQTRERGAALVVASHDWRRIEALGLPTLAPGIERLERAEGVTVRSTFGVIS